MHQLFPEVNGEHLAIQLYLGNCQTISHMNQPYLPSRYGHLFVPGVTKGNVTDG